jgi:sensor histidine kinase YesM
MEQSSKNAMMHQMEQQLHFLKDSFEETKITLQSSLILLEKDPSVVELMTDPEAAELNKANRSLNETFTYISNRFDDLNGVVSYLLLTTTGDVYSSRLPEFHTRDPLLLEATKAEMSNSHLFDWSGGGKPQPEPLRRYLPPNAMTLISTVSDNNGNILGISIAAFDYRTWLNRKISLLPVRQIYFFLDKDSRILYQTDNGSLDLEAAMESTEEFSSWSRSSRIVGLIHLDSFGWRIGSEVDINNFFGDLDQINRRYLTVLLLLTIVFITTTIFLSSLIIRPLRMVQRKMESAVKNNLLVRLPNIGHTQEVQGLIGSFNQMIQDTTFMIQRLKEEERQKEAMRYQILFQQMNPHFLQNTLNIIKWTAMDKGLDTVVKICVSLGKLLEMSVRTDIELVHLQDERQYIESYLNIQKIRFGNRMQAILEMDEELLYALVPKFCLQPLVENAIVHGISPMNQGGMIWIRVQSSDRQLSIEVEDNGSGIHNTQEKGPSRKGAGVGLSNLKERLTLLFKGQASLTIPAVAKGTLIRVRIPLLIAIPNEPEERKL